jgi:hypothetical protein
MNKSIIIETLRGELRLLDIDSIDTAIQIVNTNGCADGHTEVTMKDKSFLKTMYTVEKIKKMIDEERVKP